MSNYVGSLKEFLALNFKLEIIPFDEENEKGFVVKSPELKGLEVYGDTIEDALEEVNEAKIALYKIYTDKGIQIPYPEKHQVNNNFSGRMTIRVPKSLHQTLSTYANRNEVSLNTGIIQLLNEGLKYKEIDMIKDQVVESIIREHRTSYE